MKAIRKMSLYNVKNQLSQVVRDAEKGTSTELTRHGESAAVIIGIEQYTELSKSKNSFSSLYERFRETWGRGVNDENGEYTDPFSDIRNREPGRTVEL